ncbi:MAG: hypothetical protein GY696_25745, partial [Gammaproteobacteria bacterium]|nr:hypothetical protein [Gammaproteobacteria bacterium]
DQYGDLVLYCYDGNLTAKYAGVNYTDVADLTCGNDCVFDTNTDTNPPTELASICPTTGKWCVLSEGSSISFDPAAACGNSPNIVFGSTSRLDSGGTVTMTCTDGVLLAMYNGEPYSFNFIGCSSDCVFTADGVRDWDTTRGVAPCLGGETPHFGAAETCVLKEGQTAYLDAGGSIVVPPAPGAPGFCDNGLAGNLIPALPNDPFNQIVFNPGNIAVDDNLGDLELTCADGSMTVTYGGVVYTGVTDLTCACNCVPPIPGPPLLGCPGTCCSCAMTD